MIVKIYSYSVETRRDPVELVCHKSASLDLCCYLDTISVNITQNERVLPGECWQLFC